MSILRTTEKDKRLLGIPTPLCNQIRKFHSQKTLLDALIPLFIPEVVLSNQSKTDWEL